MAERTVICAVCGRQFETIYPNVRYCSLQCREHGRIEHRQQWLLKNPEYYHRTKGKAENE